MQLNVKLGMTMKYCIASKYHNAYFDQALIPDHTWGIEVQVLVRIRQNGKKSWNIDVENPLILQYTFIQEVFSIWNDKYLIYLSSETI